MWGRQQPAQQRQGQASAAVCQFFLRGNCRFGSTCRNRHEREPAAGASATATANATSAAPAFTPQSIAEDMRLSLVWPFSSYGPDKTAYPPVSLIPAHPFEHSPDELRWEYYKCRAENNVPAYVQRVHELERQLAEKKAEIVRDAQQAFVWVSKEVEATRARGDGAASASSAFPTGQPSAFAQPAASAFGAPAAAGTGSAFGGPAITTGSAFGAPAATTGSVFGATAATGSAFGQPSAFGATPASAFGQPSTAGSAFGAQAPAQPSAFGQPSVFGGAAASGSAFGAPAATTGSAFGAPAAIAVSAFGAPATSTGSAFGAPAFPSTTSAFGGPTPATSTTTAFGAQAASPPNVFGAPAPPPLTAEQQALWSGTDFEFGQIPEDEPPMAVR